MLVGDCALLGGVWGLGCRGGSLGVGVYVSEIQIVASAADAPREAPAEFGLRGYFLHEKASKSKLYGNEVDCTHSLTSLVKNMLCSKLHCQTVSI